MNHETTLKFQSLFTTYHLKKKMTSQQAITNSPYTQLLRALDLRFQCMRAVAAAKFPIQKPIADKEQVERVIQSVKELAEASGISDLETIADLFKHNIALAENIQSSYYHLIWTKSHSKTRDMQQLTTNAYTQLQYIIRVYNLPIEYEQEKTAYTSTDVLALARNIIQYANLMIIKALVHPATQKLNPHAQRDFVDDLEKILSNYMTPTQLSDSDEQINLLAESIMRCSIPRTQFL